MKFFAITKKKRRINWFPKMCSCLDGGSTITGGRSTARAGSYERLGSAPTIFEISSMMQRARRRIGHREEDVLDSERQEELRFYNDDQTWTAVVVEKNLRTIDLCELLKVKRNVSGIAWSIVETWPELGFATNNQRSREKATRERSPTGPVYSVTRNLAGLPGYRRYVLHMSGERTLEDHEDILAVHREMEMFAPHHERKFYFRQDFLKYEFFINPKGEIEEGRPGGGNIGVKGERAILPNGHGRIPARRGQRDLLRSGKCLKVLILFYYLANRKLQNYLSREDGECPQVFSSVWMRDELSNTWRKTYMLLRERKLYTTKKISPITFALTTNQQ
ncbi:growth factor receptor-bound protein 14-like isoform X4 [Vespula squamosa]|uniref:Growth factor receptor-bound protein 14-like isoform X4 n=1 Tax=Vespula squamosa TaxID=30214 RepID=A0ABD2BSX6_VESSQ